MKSSLLTLSFLLSSAFAHGQAMPKGMPKLPTSANLGIQGSVGTGFTDFAIDFPSSDLRVNRGVFVAAQIERGFEVLHLYLTLSLSNMTAEGHSNYRYTPLGGATSYSANNMKFSSNITDLGLGLKFKIIDGYWFRPYVEGGVLGGWHQISYVSAAQALGSQGNEFRSSDVVMGSGHYGEGGIEVMFSDAFGVKLAGRMSNYKTKEMETFGGNKLSFRTETYYFSLLFGM